jgi:predicted nucleotidyltransferase
MEQKDFLQKIKQQVLKEDKQASVILFGSRARGDNKPDSDWDVLILLTKERSTELERKLRDNIYELELEHTQPISSIILNKTEWDDMIITPFYYNVTHEGRVV